MKKNFFIFISLILVLLLNGCSFFTSHYDATRHENYTKLKAIHFKFLQDWSENKDKDLEKEWNENEVSAYCERGYLRFREAFEYAVSKDKPDNSGAKTVRILWWGFRKACKTSLNREALFSKRAKEALGEEVLDHYNRAIAGELRRVNAK